MPQPYELLEIAPEPEVDLLIIGCGNVLRGDDALGPVLIRRLWQNEDLPERVRLLDGGTSGMDVVFQMPKARSVVIVDACSMGQEPGTVYHVPGHEVENLPEPGTQGSHDFRWDNAIAFGRWLLGPHFPADIDIYLVEAQGIDFGAELSDAAEAGMAIVTEHLRERINGVRQSTQVSK